MRLEYFTGEQTFDNQAVVRRLSLMTSQGELICWSDGKWIYEGSLHIGIHRYFFFSSELFIQSKERGRERCENTAQYRHVKMFLGDLLGIILPLISWHLGPLLSSGGFQRFVRWLWSSATSQGGATQVKTVRNVRKELVKSCMCEPPLSLQGIQQQSLYHFFWSYQVMTKPFFSLSVVLPYFLAHMPLLVSRYEV